MKKSLWVLIPCLLAGGCTEQGVSNEDFGRLTGSILGGVVGKEIGGDSTGAIIAGSIIGGHIGGQIGKSMSQQSARNVAHSLETSKSGHKSTWVDPDSGYTYVLVPKKSYQSNHRVCRKFTMSVNMNGRYETTHGVACRQNGRWVIQ
ncbi:MAG TPA: RT0821/Lpp0805 family surface protein [Gammaproteobacteria bacterium]|nr:RT0821/Lpp0805 family surface protein [Gammaproteobacteria bacterium]